jgi:hypothetical protein
MKDYTPTISDSIYSHFPSNRAKSGRTRRLFSVLKKRVLLCKGQLQSTLAALAIGATFLLAVYLFLRQLAEYGWQ